MQGFFLPKSKDDRTYRGHRETVTFDPTALTSG
jgi:hypothetical protein